MNNKKENHAVFATLDDLLMMFGAALRYSMGRESYIVGTTPEFILDNLPLCNEKWLINFLEDCGRYEADRANGLIYDREDNNATWLQFHEALRAEYKRRGYPKDHKNFRMEE